jgi:hypothetical protein
MAYYVQMAFYAVFRCDYSSASALVSNIDLDPLTVDLK